MAKILSKFGEQQLVMVNYACGFNQSETGGCYPPRPSASVYNTLLDLQNSSYPSKAEFSNCFITLLKYFPFLLRSFAISLCFSPHLAPRFSRSTVQQTAQDRSRGLLSTSRKYGYVLEVERAPWERGCKLQRAALLTSLVQYDKVLSKFVQQQLIMVSYACVFNQPETGKYFE